MGPDAILRLLTARPFRPFRIHLLEKTTFDVRHPDEVMLVGSALELSGEQTVLITLLHVTRLETIPQTPSVKTNGA